MPDEGSALDLLWKTVPSWFVFPSRRPADIGGFAAPDQTIWRRGFLNLTIVADGCFASVSETDVLRLPAWCPELHLNADRTFCVGLDKLPVLDEAHARQWWADLEVHLRLLSTAVKTRVWPLHSALGHGYAGHYQREARMLADRLGLNEDYTRAVAGEESWLADLDLARVDRDGRRKPLAENCPCGCRKPSGASTSWSRCPRRRKIDRLILLERARRLALAEFWQACRDHGKRCCGSIRDCPLATGSAGEFDGDLYNRTAMLLRKRGK